MDVRCERCKTLYELDDARVSEAGTTVRCTSCGHVFRVRKKVLLMTEAVGEGGESTAVPPPVVDKPPWRVRSPSGRVIAFRELTSMQKWIVERKFGRDDEISLHGDHWKRLGDIAELQPFFLLLDDVDRVHELEDRLRRAELPDEAPSALERELEGSTPARPAEPSRPVPTPTPIRLETPIEPPSEPAPAPVAPRTGTPPGAEPGFTFNWSSGAPPSETSSPRSEPGVAQALDSEPPSAAAPPRAGTPSSFSLEAIREATRPSPDDPPMPEGPLEPQQAAPDDDADQPQFTRRAGLGVDPGVVDDGDGWEPKRPTSKAPWVAAFLMVAAIGAAAAAYFRIWVPAQEEKFRQEAERGRLEQAQKARAADEAEVRERERRAKDELLAGMAGRADAGTTAPPASDAGTGGSPPTEPPRGAAEPARPPPTAPASMTRTAPPGPAPDAPRPRQVSTPEPRARTFEDWMSLADRDREHARARAALDAYDRAIALDPSRPEAHLGQGRALLEVGDPRSAVAAFRRTLQVNPRYSAAEFWLGEAYRRTGQTSEAIGAYGRYLDAAPEGAEAGRAREALNALQ